MEGSGLTVWDVAGCQDDNEIILFHSDFLTSSDSCMNGQVVGRGISVEGNCYLSTLTINVSESLRDKLVICSFDDGSPTTHSIGNSTLSVTTGKYPG